MNAATIIYYDPVHDETLVEYDGHRIQLGGPAGDEYCYVHQTFKCAEHFSWHDWNEIHKATWTTVQESAHDIDAARLGGCKAVDNVARLIITIGLPGSGKTTWAEAQPYVNVNRDDIRVEVGANGMDDEPKVAAIRDQRIREALQAGKSVICSDTNLAPKVRRRLRNIARACYAKIEYHVFATPLAICQERNANRSRIVPPRVIQKMHDDFVATGQWVVDIPEGSKVTWHTPDN